MPVRSESGQFFYSWPLDGCGPIARSVPIVANIFMSCTFWKFAACKGKCVLRLQLCAGSTYWSVEDIRRRFDEQGDKFSQQLAASGLRTAPHCSQADAVACTTDLRFERASRPRAQAVGKNRARREQAQQALQDLRSVVDTCVRCPFAEKGCSFTCAPITAAKSEQAFRMQHHIDTVHKDPEDPPTTVQAPETPAGASNIASAQPLSQSRGNATPAVTPPSLATSGLASTESAPSTNLQGTPAQQEQCTPSAARPDLKERVMAKMGRQGVARAASALAAEPSATDEVVLGNATQRVPRPLCLPRAWGRKCNFRAPRQRKEKWQLGTIDKWVDLYRAGFRGPPHIPTQEDQVRILNEPYDDPAKHLTIKQITARFMGQLGKQGKKPVGTTTAQPATAQAPDKAPSSRKAGSKRGKEPSSHAPAAKRPKPGAAQSAGKDSGAESSHGSGRGNTRGRGQGRGRSGARGRGSRPNTPARGSSDEDYMPEESNQVAAAAAVPVSDQAEGGKRPTRSHTHRMRGAGSQGSSHENSSGASQDQCADSVPPAQCNTIERSDSEGSEGAGVLEALQDAALEAACCGANRSMRMGAADPASDDGEAAPSAGDEVVLKNVLQVFLQNVYDFEKDMKMAQSSVFSAAAEAFIDPPVGDEAAEIPAPDGIIADLCFPDEYEGEE